MVTDETVAARIRQVRTALGLTQAQFAKALGISKPAVVHYESGRRFPRAAILQRIAAVSSKPMDWFLGAIASKPPEGTTLAIQVTDPELAETLSGLAAVLDSGQRAKLLAGSRVPRWYARRFLERVSEIRRRGYADLERLRGQLERELEDYGRLLEAQWTNQRRARRIGHRTKVGRHAEK